MDLETPSFILFEHTIPIVQLQKLHFPSLVFLFFVLLVGVFSYWYLTIQTEQMPSQILWGRQKIVYCHEI